MSGSDLKSGDDTGWDVMFFALACLAIGGVIGCIVLAFCDVGNVVRILSNRKAGYMKDSMDPVVLYYALNALVFLPMCRVLKNKLTFVNLGLCWPALVLPVILLPLMFCDTKVANEAQVLLGGALKVIIVGTLIMGVLLHGKRLKEYLGKQA